jgi:hypothetical protein
MDGTAAISNSASAGLIDSVLGTGIKSNYTFSYSANPASPAPGINCVALPGAPVQNNAAVTVQVGSYSINASPGACAAGNGNYYFTDMSGVIRMNNLNFAGPADAPLAG